MKKIIAVDLDEVLGFFIDPLCKFHNEVYGTNLTRADFHSYSFADVWGGTRAESIDKVFEFFKSHHFTDIPTVPGAKKGLTALRDAGFELVIVTSRQHAIENTTREWVARHYPGFFREIAFGNHWGKEGKKTSKRELCAELGACALIDDSLGYAEELAEAGFQAVLFDYEGTYEWNKPKNGMKDPSGVSRVRNWDEVIELIVGNK